MKPVHQLTTHKNGMNWELHMKATKTLLTTAAVAIAAGWCFGRGNDHRVLGRRLFQVAAEGVS